MIKETDVATRSSNTLTPIDGNDELVLRLQAFNLKINTDPAKSRLRKTPDAKASYLPIAMLENDLRTDFNGLVQYQILSERRELNEYIVTCRIIVFHPIINQWLSYDGVGATQIIQNRVQETDASGNIVLDNYGKPKTRTADLIEFDSTKQKNALQMNAPKAYAEAIKNAAKKIGSKYGSNINRKAEDVESYQPEELIDEISIEVVEQFEKVKTIAQLTEVFNLYPEYKHLTKFKVLFQNKRIELQAQ